MTCMRCKCRQAEPKGYSLFQLCTRCAWIVCPGPDAVKYEELRREFGYDRKS